jgi:hypothetical protein
MGQRSVMAFAGKGLGGAIIRRTLSKTDSFPSRSTDMVSFE